MSKSSKVDIFDALTSSSSADGCDPDWRNKVLANADSTDLKDINEFISSGGNLHTDEEMRHELLKRA